MEIFLSVLWALFKVPVIFCVCVTAVFVMLFLFWYCRLYFSGYRPKGEESRYFVKKRTFFQKLLIDFPRQYAMDVVTRDRQEFPYRGMIIFTGRQGNGKTISMVQAITQCKAEFPECKVLTNFAFSGEDEVLDHWRKLTDFSNGKKGVVVGMDETQNWFSSSQSKNFPPEMLQVITQNRKNRRVIFGTAQNFYLLSKAIRSQTTEVRACLTLFGCLTIVRRKEPVLDADGNVSEWRHLGTYFYVHSAKLRASYDTYKCIETLSNSGFNEVVKVQQM